MKFRHIIFSFALIIAGGCSSAPVVGSKQLIENQIDDTTYAVIVPQDDGSSSQQAKRLARQRAAEISVDQGYRYFTIVSEQEVQLLKSDWDGSNFQDPPTNLYQELIIDKNFSRDALQKQLPSSSSLVPAYRLVFQMHKERSLRGSIDACTLTECSEDNASH